MSKTLDPEIKAMRALYRTVFKSLNNEQALRVLKWALARLLNCEYVEIRPR